ncbi:uncharacterized protein A4U43_C10F14880 [Asparagus officinalis]|uniref:Protein kinase domain-containing protein n=1 Tax=Asparagus officinalis TaxID=4686 RepID=A0A5P1E624_ASPOF|nr:uncharacterized protein A4U43_C10F14880 [Asparagus officinalis]
MSEIADFWKEALTLSSLHHSNVVSFYGVVRDDPDRSLATVTEFMVNVSLKQFLQKKYRDWRLITSEMMMDGSNQIVDLVHHSYETVMEKVVKKISE